LSRAELEAAMMAADMRLQLSQLYVDAAAAERRLTTKDQSRIAGGARAASVRVQAGRASPLEQQRADVAKVNVEANLERQKRLSRAARINLKRRIAAHSGPCACRLWWRSQRSQVPGRVISTSHGLLWGASTAACHRIRFLGRFPSRRWGDLLPTGSQAHCARLLTRQARWIEIA
jgi:hypothetical protein